ncbi:phage tail tape measure protein [Microbacterium sp. QXD-8]|uniref:Phage tail tape measure protein n=1 Tax=Microbacterium psychrotolerans TaxID=3068321 RepID=A0ABU0YYG1_9MICO|nr:phage tail tape measure protein [Microbacterium sp. QXD-8]MDQ7877374.1 phage tail tape measure protein [Microbacterium sp. QXD-8]
MRTIADRTVKVNLILAAQGYMSGMEQAAQKTAQTGTELEKLNQKRQAFTQLGASAVGFGAAVALGVGMAVSKFADFDQQMSYVQAATHETAANMGLLREAALDAGARTVYSATEAAGAIEELARAGVKTKDILAGGLDAALDLAAAGGLEVADAAAIAATTLNQFRLRGEQASHVADLLAAGAGKAQGDVSDMSAALAQSGLVANQFKLSVDETVGTLSAFASAGLLGSDAGTSFRTMLLRLANPTGEAADKMKELGINAYDAQGQFIGMSGLAGQLQKGLRGLTQEQQNAALAIIFGQDAIRGANVLLEAGASGIDEWTDKVNDQGYAAETAAMRLDNLKGDVEQLGGAFDTALIQSGEGANDALRALVQTATGAVGMFADLPAPIQATALYLGMAAAAVGLVGGAALIATPRIAEFRAIVSAAGLSMKGLSLLAGGVTLGLTAVIAIIAAVGSAQAEARAKAKAYADTLEEGTQRITASTRDMAKEALAAKNSFLWIEQDSAYDAARKLGISLDLVTDAATGNAAALEELQKQIDAGADGSLAYANSAVDIENAVRGEAASLAEAIEMARQKEEADRESARSSQTAADAYLEAASGAEELQTTLSELIATINEANGVGQDAVTTNAAWQEALAGISAEVEAQKAAYESANGTLDGFVLSLDQSTVSGSANAAMLADVAGRAQAAAESQYAVDQSTMSAKDSAEKYAATLAAQREAFVNSAIAAGYNADEVNALADEVFRLPSKKEVEVLANTAPALATIQDFKNRFGVIQGVINYRAVISAETGVERPGRAFGGPIYGPGGPTDDKAGLYRLSNGEHVWTAAEVAGAGGHGAVAQMRAAAKSGSRTPDFSYGQPAARYAPSPTYLAVAGGRQGSQLTVDQRGAQFFAYDPHEVAREQREQMTRLLDASGI